MSSLIEPDRYPVGAEVCFMDRTTIARHPNTAVVALGFICGAAEEAGARVKVPVSAVREDRTPIMVWVDAVNILGIQPPSLDPEEAC